MGLLNVGCSLRAKLPNQIIRKNTNTNTVVIDGVRKKVDNPDSSLSLIYVVLWQSSGGVAGVVWMAAAMF